MSSYDNDFGWMLDPRLRRTGIIAPQTAEAAKGRLVGGYTPPPTPLERYMAQITAPPVPATFPPDHPVNAMRALRGTSAPAAPRLVFSQPAASDFPAILERVAGPVAEKAAPLAGGGPMSQFKEGADVEEAAILARGNLAASAATEKGIKYGEYMAEAEKHRQTRESLIKDQQQARSEAESTYRYASEDARRQDRYPGMDLDDIIQNEQIVANKDGRYKPEQVRVAQAALKKSEEIDPERIYGGSTGRKIMAAIGMALGAYGAALARTPNYAMQIVQSAIENDIAAQKEAFERRGQSAERIRSEAATNYELVAKHYQTDIDRVTAMEAINHSRIADYVEQVMIKYAPAEAKATAMQMAGQFRQNAAMKQSELAARNEQMALERKKLEMMGGGSSAPPPGLVPLPGYNPTEKDTQAAQKVLSSTSVLKNAIQRLKAIRDRAGVGGYEVLDRSLVNEGKSALADAITAYKEAKALGALDKGALTLAENVLGGDPTGAGFRSARYDALLKALDTDIGSQLKPYGFTVGGADEEQEAKTAQEAGVAAH